REIDHLARHLVVLLTERRAECSTHRQSGGRCGSGQRPGPLSDGGGGSMCSSAATLTLGQDSERFDLRLLHERSIKPAAGQPSDATVMPCALDRSQSHAHNSVHHVTSMPRQSWPKRWTRCECTPSGSSRRATR